MRLGIYEPLAVEDQEERGKNENVFCCCCVVVVVNKRMTWSRRRRRAANRQYKKLVERVNKLTLMKHPGAGQTYFSEMQEKPQNQTQERGKNDGLSCDLA